MAALIMTFLSLETASAQQKIATKPVEPFYRAVSVDAPAVYEPHVTYLSPEKVAPVEYTSLGANWKQTLPPGTDIDLEVRLKSKGKYSDWYMLDPSIDEKYATEDNSTVSAFLTTNPADGYQYRISLNSQNSLETPVLDHLKFTFINGGTPQDRTDLLQHSSNNDSAGNEEYLPENFNAASLVGAKTSSLVKSTSLLALAEPTLVPASTIRTTVKTPVRATKKTTTSVGKLKIISRAEWGADESLRLLSSSGQNEAKLIQMEDDYYTKYADELKESRRVETDENGNKLTWPLSYPESVKKIIVHHTATTKNLDDPAQAIRDIYVWHTLSKGWGDIGYNYIIDQQGNIYEGRYGGEMVVGAHAGRGNHGSIGIAILGNYQDEDPPEAVLTSLTALIREKSEIYKIDTEGSSLFRGETYPNVMGHRDIMSTSCPGDKLYALLPVIRKLAKSQIVSVAGTQVMSDYDFGWAGNGAPVISILPKSKKMAVLKLKNTGKNSWNKDTYFKIRPNQNAQIFLRNYQEILTEAVGQEVKPGQTVEIKVLLNSTVTSGAALIDLQPVINGNTTVARFLSFGLQVNTPAPKKKFDYDFLSVIYGKTEFRKGDLVEVTIKLRNKGTSPWQNAGSNKVTLGSDKPRDHKNQLLSVPSARLASQTETLVQSGEIATFKFTVKVPDQDGIYREYFTPVVEGIQWMDNHESFLQIKVGNSDKLMTPDVEEGAATETKSATPTGSTTVNVAPTKLNIDSRPRNIRIDLAYRGNPAVISANGNFSIYEGANKLADLSADQQVNVKYESGVFKVTAKLKTYTVSSRPRFIPSAGVIMRIDNWERRNTWGDKANNNEFRGILEALIYDGELHFINELPLEDYLKGIAEESSDAPDEKIKTIMVIARTYARFYMDVVKKFPGAPFDLNDDPNYSQKYLGYSFEERSPKTARLASETAGQYVTWQGKLIKTPYFSKSDGTRTISAENKWGWTDTPFLVSVDDSQCKSTAFSGHGVGLSGCGATALAQQGKTYQDIIKYYYQGTAVVQSAR
jgi:hypothetical protein